MQTVILIIQELEAFLNLNTDLAPSHNDFFRDIERRLKVVQEEVVDKAEIMSALIWSPR